VAEGWCWFVAGWLLMTDLFWEKSTADLFGYRIESRCFEKMGQEYVKKYSK
jgi:hypothetical protein